MPVEDDDEILLMTARGKIQRIACNDIKPIGRNTQGVRIMGLDEGDSLAVVVRVPRDEDDDGVNSTLSEASEPELDASAAEQQPEAGEQESSES